MKFLGVAVRAGGWCLTAVITILSLVPPQFRPETDVPHDFEHFGIFFVTGIAYGLGYRHRSMTIPVALIGFAAMIELAQTIVPGRHARLSDFIVDAVAASGGAAAASLAANRSAKYLNS